MPLKGLASDFFNSLKLKSLKILQLFAHPEADPETSIIYLKLSEWWGFVRYVFFYAQLVSLQVESSMTSESF